MDAHAAEEARGLSLRLGEAKGPDRELDLQVFRLVTGEALEWVKPGEDPIWAKRTVEAAQAPTGDADWDEPAEDPAPSHKPDGWVILPRLTISLDEALNQVKAAGFNACEIEANLSDRLKIPSRAHIRTWVADSHGAVGRGPTRSGQGSNPALAVCQALVVALLGKAGHIPEDADS